MDKICLIGPPAAGKSTIFSLFIGKPFFPRPKVERLTRDRHYKIVEVYDKQFILIDTGGIVFSDEEMDKSVLEQTEIAIKEADIVLFVVDGRKGITPLVKNISRLLHKEGKKTFLIVNKIDHKKHELNTFEFEELGWKNVIKISALHKINIDELYDLAYKNIRKYRIKKEKSEMSFSSLIIGKQNSGKSTLFNYLLKEKRSIVSKIPGTTREPVEGILLHENLKILIKDTAGIPRKFHGKEIEIFNWKHILLEIKNIDTAIFIIDLEKGITRQDKRIAHFLTDNNIPFIITGNKCDVVKTTEKNFENFVKENFPFITSPFVSLISALTGYGIKDLIKKLIDLNEKNSGTFKKRDLVKIIEDYREFFISSGILLKDINQVASSPIVIKVSYKNIRRRAKINEKKLSKNIKNIFYKSFSLQGIPLIIKFKKIK